MSNSKQLFVTLKMIQSLDGSIARTIDDKLDWGSTQDKASFKQVRLANDVIVMGSTTFVQTPKSFLRNQSVIIISRDPDSLQSQYVDQKGNQNWFFCVPDPQQILDLASSKGWLKVLLAGGGRVNSIFLKAGLVDILEITLAPYIFNAPTKVFGSDVLEDIALELISYQPLGSGELLLRYKLKG